MSKVFTPYSFWKDALRVDGSALPLIWPRVAAFGLWAFILALVHYNDELPDLQIEVAPFEAAGAGLGLLLVLRSNAGYERWWEGRRLWGSLINTTRSLAIAATAYGPDDPPWRERIGRRIAAFGHVARRSLRGERDMPEVVALLGPEEAGEIAGAVHMPSDLARRIAEDLRSGLDDFAFVQADALRVALLDHVGGCERINTTPLPLAYAIEVRRFLFLFLATLPFVLFNKLPKLRALWIDPLVTLLVSYALLSIDKIGHELQQPFQPYRLNHLPLDALSATIEANALATLGVTPAIPVAPGRS